MDFFLLAPHTKAYHGFFKYHGYSGVKAQYGSLNLHLIHTTKARFYIRDVQQVHKNGNYVFHPQAMAEPFEVEFNKVIDPVSLSLSLDGMAGE